MKKTRNKNKLTKNKCVKCVLCNKHAGHIAKDSLEHKKELNKDIKKATGVITSCCMFDYKKDIFKVTDKVKKTETESNRNNYNENKHNKNNKYKCIFVSICDEIVSKETKPGFSPLLPGTKTS